MGAKVFFWLRNVLEDVNYRNTGGRWSGFGRSDHFAVRWTGRLRIFRTDHSQLEYVCDSHMFDDTLWKALLGSEEVAHRRSPGCLPDPPCVRHMYVSTPQLRRMCRQVSSSRKFSTDHICAFREVLGKCNVLFPKTTFSLSGSGGLKG